MRVLLFGESGQLGWELTRSCPPDIILSTYANPSVDFCRPLSVKACIRCSNPDVIINAAAYTQVDKAETEREIANQINGETVGVIAEQAKINKCKFIHISTDYVFSGESNRPYRTDDETFPKSVYGETKLSGEKKIVKTLGEEALIIRTAWLYSAHGNNFVKSMLRLMSERETLDVVDDQIGTPTWAKGLARLIWISVKKNIQGVYHWTDSGVASWYDFAVAIYEEARCLGILEKEVAIVPVSASGFSTIAKRPYYSVLDKRKWAECKIEPSGHWRMQLREMLTEFKKDEI